MIELAIAGAIASCSWDRPGHNQFTGDVVASVDRYTDIAAPTRAKLKRRMAARAYDEIVTIRRDAIYGSAVYLPEIRDMHFGSGRVCRSVTRAKWSDSMVERGLVYCEDGQCILVPTVCRNVSRITKIDDGGPIDISPSAGGGLRYQPLVLTPVSEPHKPPPDVSWQEMARSPIVPTGQASVDRWAYSPIVTGAPLIYQVSPTPPVNEPAAAAMLAIGVAIVFMAKRRRSHP